MSKYSLPAVLYHGTDADFSTFDDSKLGSANGTAPANIAGFNFTSSVLVAKTFGKRVIAVKLNLESFYIVDAKGQGYSGFKHAINNILDRIDRKSYDGLIIRNYGDAGVLGDNCISSDHTIVFKPHLIRILDSNVEVNNQFIEIDGISRSRFNSHGDPIADTDTALEEFWRWYGNSEFIDDFGRPYVAYHGTKAGEFDEFDTSGGAGKTHGTGAFFTDSKENAKTYGDVRAFYLNSGSKVAEVSFRGKPWNQAPVDWVAYDYDGEEIGRYEDKGPAELAAGSTGTVIDYRLDLDEDGHLALDYTANDGGSATTDDLAMQARHYGFSCFVAENVIDVKSGVEAAKPSTTYVMFDSKQIRSVESVRMASPHKKSKKFST